MRLLSLVLWHCWNCRTSLSLILPVCVCGGRWQGIIIEQMTACTAWNARGTWQPSVPETWAPGCCRALPAPVLPSGVASLAAAARALRRCEMQISSPMIARRRSNIPIQHSSRLKSSNPDPAGHRRTPKPALVSANRMSSQSRRSRASHRGARTTG